ncbi:MAG: hypothetical protein NVS4B3_08990 [Gemmatimonadaceae bacterium]
MATYRRRQLQAVRQALDEARFGRERTLNLRATLPTVPDALARTEAWLREKQVAQTDDVLIVTGRGNNSPEGKSVVHDAVEKLLRTLKRKGVVRSYAPYTSGSFTVSLAAVSALWESPKRKRDDGTASTRADPPSLAALGPETREVLRALALRSLDALGIRDAGPFVQQEMLAQFGAISAGVPEGPLREERLQQAALRAMIEYED